ncbi:MAG: MFS transporter [Chloroflexota bacterium]
MQRLPSVPIPMPTRLYYGWVIVATGLVINIASAPLNPVVFSFFIAPMTKEMGWSLGAVSLALTFRLVVSGVTAPLIGLIIDRFGPRWLGLFAGLAAGASLIGLFYARQLWLLYLLFALSGAVGLGGGPGGSLLTLVPVAKWFILKRGRAMSIATTGVALGTLMAIPASQWMIQTIGWREAWVIFGVLVAVIIVPLSLLFLRGSPSDLGLEPDGFGETRLEPLSADNDNHQNTAIETDWTAKEALRHPVSWSILTALAVGGFSIGGTLLHRVAYWEGTGMSPSLVAFGIAMDPLTVIFSVVIFGLIGERVKTRWLGLFGGLGFSLSMLPMILSTGQAYTIIAHSMIWATGAGAYITANNLIWPNYFGRRFLGTIRGIGFPVQVAATGLGPPVYGFLLDAGLAPTTLWMISTGLFTTAGLLLFQARPPQRKVPAQGALGGGGTKGH